MNASLTEGFDIPPDFTLEEIDGQLYREDLDDDDELWLIRMPCDIKLSNLDKKKIHLSDNSGDTSIKNITTEDGKLLECYMENCEIPSTCIVLPQKNDGQLHVVKKKFKGALLISEGLSYDEIDIKAETEELDDTNPPFESTKEKSETRKHSLCDLETNELEIKPDNEDGILKANQRSSNIKEKKNKKKHKQSESNFDTCEVDVKSEDDNEQLESASNSANEAKEKKNKKKKKQSQFNFDLSELNYETEDTSKPISEFHKQKKRSHTHKKTSSEGAKIKNEPLPMVWDMFPMCTSQK